MSNRTQRWLLWVSGFVLAAGIAAVLIVFVGDTGSKEPDKFTAEPIDKVETLPKEKVALASDAKLVAGEFVQTAVRRRNLAKAWTLVGPAIRQDMTYKEWLKGDIPVIPFLQPIKLAPLHPQISTKNYALAEVILLPDKGKGELYSIELIKVGKGDKAHWVVNSWVPRSAPAIPTNQSS